MASLDNFRRGLPALLARGVPSLDAVIWTKTLAQHLKETRTSLFVYQNPRSGLVESFCLVYNQDILKGRKALDTADHVCTIIRASDGKWGDWNLEAEADLGSIPVFLWRRMKGDTFENFSQVKHGLRVEVSNGVASLLLQEPGCPHVLRMIR